MALMSVDLYEEQRRKREMYRDIELSEEQIAQGKTKNAKEALAALYQIPEIRAVRSLERKKE